MFKYKKKDSDSLKDVKLTIQSKSLFEGLISRISQHGNRRDTVGGNRDQPNKSGGS